MFGGVLSWQELRGIPPELFPPGAGFYRDGTGQNTMRLNFSNQPADRIREGVKRLGEVVRERLAKAA